MQPVARITLLIGPAAAGKTEAALAALRAPRRGRALLLAPGAVQQQQLDARLRSESFGRVRTHQFFSLTRLVLGRAQVADLSETARTLLLRATLRRLAAEGRLPRFGRVAHKPGFVATVAALIAEAQQAMIEPAALAAADLTPYDAELGAIYAAYTEAQTQRVLADDARRLTLARNALRAEPARLRGVELLVVDGFDQFTPLQLSLLAEVTRQVGRSLITLTGAAIARPAHRRFARTRDQLRAALGAAGDLVVSYLPAAPDSAPTAHPSLAHVERHLFDLDAPPPVDAAGALALIEAADREREVRAALRRVRDLLAAGAAPDQVALLFRDATSYAPLLREVAAEYKLPLTLLAGQPLAEAPLAVALLTLLRLPLEDYPRRSLVETLRAITHGAGDWEQAEATAPLATAQFATLLDRAARAAGLAGGQERLRSQLRLLAEAPPPEPTGDDTEAPPLTPAEAEAALQRLDAFIAWLTPPERTTMAKYAGWTRARMTALLPPAEPLAPRPVAARLDRALSDLAAAAELLAEPPLSYSAFVAELEAAIRAARYGRDKLAPGQVAALPVLAARGVCFEHVVVLGLAEGEFPLRLPEPPLYSRRERAALARSGIALPAPDPADERSLFYETAARARRSLTLTRTYLDESGNPLPRSPYLTALLDLFPPATLPTERARAGSAPPLEQAASPQETLIALVAAKPAEPAVLPAPLDPQLLAHVRRAGAIERDREATGGYGPFEGLIADPAAQERLAQIFGPQHRWSITQINDYITCPFRFAAAHLLRLERRGEPEEGLDRAGRGRLYHRILAEAGRQWRQMAHLHTPANAEPLLEALETAAAAVLAEAPARDGFTPNAFWEWQQAEIKRRLARALRRVLQEGGDWAAFRPAGIEQSFGLERGAPPLRLDTAAGPVLVAGRIDRIDQRDDRALALLDYKSSSTPRPLDETLSGRDVQLAVYLLAAEQLLAPGQRVERAAFLHLGSGKRSRPLTDRDRDQALAAMRARVAEAVQGARTGDFAVRPRDDCPPGCTYQTICRLNLRKRDANAMQAQAKQTPVAEDRAAPTGADAD